MLSVACSGTVNGITRKGTREQLTLQASFDRSLMIDIADDLVGRDFAVWNIDYRCALGLQVRLVAFEVPTCTCQGVSLSFEVLHSFRYRPRWGREAATQPWRMWLWPKPGSMARPSS